MKKIVGVLITILFVLVGNNIAYAARDNEFRIISSENEHREKDVEDIKRLIQMSYSGEWDNVKIYDHLSYYDNAIDEVIYVYPIYKEAICVLLAYSDGKGSVTLTEDTKIYDEIVSAKNTGLYGSNIYNSELNIYEDNKIIKLYGEDVGKNKIIADVDLSKVDNYKSVVSSVGKNQWGSTVATKKCNITNFVKQGNNGLCWASAVATIANYKRGLSLSATMVADKMNIGYNQGATLEQTRSALSLYGLSYTSLNNKMSWSRVVTNIKIDKPFIIAMTSNVGGHIITGYGYVSDLSDKNAINRAVLAWDSNGNKITFPYSAPYIVISGVMFTWANSLY